MTAPQPSVFLCAVSSDLLCCISGGGECGESVAIQSDSFDSLLSLLLLLFFKPYTHSAASQFYTMLRCTVDIPYSCHTTLIPPRQGINAAAAPCSHLCIITKGSVMLSLSYLTLCTVSKRKQQV